MLTLPCCDMAAPDRTKMPTGKRPEHSILIIDDHGDSREALAEVLSDEGYSVVTAEDGADGLAYLRTGPHPRVILLDLMMPGTDGWDFRAEQKRDAAIAQIPVIAISAAGKLLDADYSLRKPIKVDALLTILRDVPGRAV
jgi:CheY-like chemotaxis protein